MSQFIVLLTSEQLNTLFQGLHELPGKVCNPLLMAIQSQLTPQQQTDIMTNIKNSPEVQARVDEAQANSDSMANE
jgi:hypothetical protein